MNPINPEKEYDCLRQEILKRLEIQHTLLNIKLTTDAVFLGLGINSNSNLLLLLVPIFSLLFTIVWRNNTYYKARISAYIILNYQNNLTNGSWEFDRHTVDKSHSFFHRAFMASGVFGLFIISPIIGLAIVISKESANSIEQILIIVDFFAIAAISVIYFKYNYSVSSDHWKKAFFKSANFG